MSKTNREGCLWTRVEDDRLKLAAEKGLFAPEIAKMLNRTVPGIEMRARKFGLSVRAPLEKVAAESWDYVSEHEARDRDEAYVRRVLKANVYGFGRSILVDVAALRKNNPQAEFIVGRRQTTQGNPLQIMGN